MARVGADLKQRVVDSMKNTWNSFYQFTMFHRPDAKSLEAEVDTVNLICNIAHIRRLNINFKFISKLFSNYCLQ